MFLFGVTYPHPSEIPHRTPAPRYSSHRDLRLQANPERASPDARRQVETRAENLMFLSASGPNIAAPIPRKKMLRQKVKAI
jgi:hypothetical protein